MIQLDLLPTALAAAGRRRPKPEWKLDGVNLLPYLTGRDDRRRRTRRSTGGSGEQIGDPPGRLEARPLRHAPPTPGRGPIGRAKAAAEPVPSSTTSPRTSARPSDLAGAASRQGRGAHGRLAGVERAARPAPLGYGGRGRRRELGLTPPPPVRGDGPGDLKGGDPRQGPPVPRESSSSWIRRSSSVVRAGAALRSFPADFKAAPASMGAPSRTEARRGPRGRIISGIPKTSCSNFIRVSAARLTWGTPSRSRPDNCRAGRS